MYSQYGVYEYSRTEYMILAPTGFAPNRGTVGWGCIGQPCPNRAYVGSAWLAGWLCGVRVGAGPADTHSVSSICVRCGKKEAEKEFRDLLFGGRFVQMRQDRLVRRC